MHIYSDSLYNKMKYDKQKYKSTRDVIGNKDKSKHISHVNKVSAVLRNNL